MTVQVGQPFVRHSLSGPYAVEGKSFVPKVILIELDVTQAGNYDFMTIPAGSYISRVVGHIEVALDGVGTVEFGTDSNGDEFIDTLDWTETTLDQVATNIGSANADSPGGAYFAAADVLRVTVGGTPTVGKVRFFMEYFELADMFAKKGHFDSTL